MRFELTIPARINILGNPSDALEGDHCTITTAIEMRAGGTVEPADDLVIDVQDKDVRGVPRVKQRIELQGRPPYPYDGQCDLVKGAINRLYAYSPELREKWAERRPHVAFWTDVPRQSGLGGSTLFVLLTLAGLRALYELDPRYHNNYVLSEMAQNVEAHELNITCGFADRYVPLFGGLAYLDYRGKLWQKGLGEEPYVTYERLDAFCPTLTLVLAHTGVVRDSGDVHRVLRGRYLEEYVGCGNKPAPFMVDVMEQIGATAWQGKIALLQHDLPRFGRLMSQNHSLINGMMEYCGFNEGAGWANNLLIDAAMAHGALGAKLTGAGGGGSVFALVPPGEESRVASALLSTARENGLAEASVFTTRPTGVGLTVHAVEA